MNKSLKLMMGATAKLSGLFFVEIQGRKKGAKS